MEDALELAERLWQGDVETSVQHPVIHHGQLVRPVERVAFVPSFANVSAFDTDDGLVLVDTGSSLFARAVHSEIRQWSPRPLHTAVYSHGHIDHVFGVEVFEEESKACGWPAPVVVAHDALPARFDRYVLTAGYNAVINRRQFQIEDLTWPTRYRYPDRTYSSALELEVGGLRFLLHHARGETDDHTWTWVPERRVLCPGDLFIWASPNAGNPQKVQRYPAEWAAALREMAALDPAPEILLPGHGVPILGVERIRQALGDTAELLESLVEQVLRLMNEGARLDDIIHSVKAPPHLVERPYLRPVYDEPEFIVRNIWRLYGGWYDGNPASLKPAPDAAVALELASLAGGVSRLADRALELLELGDVRLACHLAEMAALAAPDDAGVHAARAAVFERRAEESSSTMARGVYGWAALESRRRSSESPAGEGPSGVDG